MRRTQAELAYYRRKASDPKWRERRNSARRTGRPTGRPPIQLAERIWEYVQKTDTCWLWTGAVDKDGYGQTSDRGKPLKAHRAMYELLVGPIPPSMTLDHVKARGCTSPSCVNPAHLEPVNTRENVIRGIGPATAGARNAAKMHCPKGHPYDAANTRVDRQGRRHCKACHG